MKILSYLNEINYGSYEEGLDWNIQNYQTINNGLTNKKFQNLLESCLRINIFSQKLQAEIEFLKSRETLRILLIGYDMEHDVYLEKTWMLTTKQFAWEGTPEKYQIQGRNLGLDFDVRCDSSGSLHFHFSYFDHYQIHFISHIHRLDRKPLRNVNPFDFDTWSFSEKHAMLDCSNMDLTLDGNNHSQHPSFAAGLNVSYEWFGGYFPCVTKELRCQFWQRTFKEHKSKLVSEINTSTLVSNEELNDSNSKERVVQQYPDLLEMAGSLLMMGHDSCSSESAVWVEQRIRYRLPRIVPSFGRSVQGRQSNPSHHMGKDGKLLPDLEWNISAGKYLNLNFQPFSVSTTPRLAFPLTQTQRLYGLFYGKLLDQFGDAMPIQKALGFIDYRQIQWRKS